MSNAAGELTALKAMVDFERIMEQLERLNGIAGEVREKAGAIKSLPSPEWGKEAREPRDASEKIFAAIKQLTNILVSARESLNAFI